MVVFLSLRAFFLAPGMLRKSLMIVVLAILGFIALGLGIGVIATSIAPRGYEDEEGFHFGQEEPAALEQISHRVPEPKMV